MTVAITATTQATWPPRVAVTVSGLTAGDVVTVYRSSGGVRTAVRSAADVTMAGTTLGVVDAETPFGVPVLYVAHVNAADAAQTASATYSLPGGKVALSDAIGGQAAEVVITAWPEREKSRPSTMFVIAGRNVVVSGPLAQATGRVELFTETASARDSLLALLATATSGVVQVRQPGGYVGVDSYLSVRTVTERRFSQDGTDDRRAWILDVAEVDPWPAALSVPRFTLQDIADAYDTLTLAAIAADHADLVSLSLADFGV